MPNDAAPSKTSASEADIYSPIVNHKVDCYSYGDPILGALIARSEPE